MERNSSLSHLRERYRAHPGRGGCGVGAVVDEYAIERFGGGEPPTQMLVTFHPRRGLTDISYIDLARTDA